MLACTELNIPMVLVYLFLDGLRDPRCVHSQYCELHSVRPNPTHPQTNVFAFFMRLYMNFQPCFRAVAT